MSVAETTRYNYPPNPIGEIMPVVERQGRLTTRSASIVDIPELVDVDMRSFGQVYAGYEQSEDELRAELTDKFYNRYNLVGPDWIKVAERDGKIVGFMMCCPTSKDPHEFTSWEESTDNGNLDKTYDPNGKNLYIVSLSMLRSGSVDLGQNMLFGSILAEFMKQDFELAYFESRLPGLRDWVTQECGALGIEIADLEKYHLDDLANIYAQLKRVNKKGELVPYDRLLEIYTSAGCEFGDVYPDAYQDAPSLNYGVLGIFKNPMPERIRKNKVVRELASTAIGYAAKSNYLMRKAF